LFESIREDSKKFTQKQIIPQNIFGLVWLFFKTIYNIKTEKKCLN
jgi:hypothetical protein